ncbi:hypothetical protein M8494_27320 [Serratia ureilytica]
MSVLESDKSETPQGALALLALMQTGAARAAATADMVFYGTLNAPPPCTINNGQTVEVDFCGDRVIE